MKKKQKDKEKELLILRGQIGGEPAVFIVPRRSTLEKLKAMARQQAWESAGRGRRTTNE